MDRGIKRGVLVGFKLEEGDSFLYKKVQNSARDVKSGSGSVFCKQWGVAGNEGNAREQNLYLKFRLDFYIKIMFVTCLQLHFPEFGASCGLFSIQSLECPPPLRAHPKIQPRTRAVSHRYRSVSLPEWKL